MGVCFHFGGKESEVCFHFGERDFWVWGLGSSSSVLRGEELIQVMPLDEALYEADQQQQQQLEEDAGSVSTNKKNLVGGGWVGWACLWLPFLEGGGSGLLSCFYFWKGVGGGGGGFQLSFFIYPLR